MAHKRHLINKKRWEESQQDALKTIYGLTSSTKAWFIKATIAIISLYFVCHLYVTVFPSVLSSLLYVVPITLSVFIIHEALHFVTATLLGYKTKWFPINMARIPYTRRYLQMEGFDVIFPNQAAADKHNRLIGLAPYLLVFPLSLIFLLTGTLFLQVSGLILIITHLFSLNFEGIQHESH